MELNLKTWIMSTLRRASFRFPNRNEAKRLARIERGLYKCAVCEGAFRDKDTVIDHIEPVVPFDGFPIHPVTGTADWTVVIPRLFCDVNGFQVLCDPCHDVKTTIEDTMRANHNKKLKDEEKQLKKETKLKKKLDKQNKV